MKLYICNCTHQDHDFTYRLPETNKVACQRVHAGAQMMVYKDATKDEIDYILQQHEAYGLVDIRSLKTSKGFVGLCYSVDRVIDPENIMLADEQNQKAILDRTVDIHQTNAASISSVMDKNGATGMNSFEQVITEQVKEGGTVKDGHSTTIELTSEQGRRRGRPAKQH